jgi:hypothetical protein
MNNIYGILTNGAVTDQRLPGYRYTDCRRTTDMANYLSSLMDDAGDKLGVRANFIIQLLRSSSLWPLFIHQMDKMNTYDIDGAVEGHGLTMSRLVSWAEQVPVTATYYTHPGDDDIHLVITKLWSVLDGGML